MKTLSIMAAMLMLALSATLVMADDAPATPAPKHKMANFVRGTITKIDGVNVTVQPATPKNAPAGTAAPDAKTFATDDKTVVTQGTKDGDKKAVSDLAVKQNVAVILSDDGKTAVNIIISPTMGQHKKGGNAAGN